MKILTLGEVTPLLRSLLLDNQINLTEAITADIDMIIVRGGIKVDTVLIEKLPQLKIVISAGIGVDNIDLEYCAKRKILVCNCPKASTISVAEHTLAMLLAGTKNIVRANDSLKRGIWDRQNNMGFDARGKVVGIVGLGRIGSKVAKLLNFLGYKILAYDPYIKSARFTNVGVIQVKSLQELVKKSNYLLLHTPKTVETIDLFKDIDLNNLKRPNGIVNTSRGGILSEEKVKDLLKKGVLGFYACDVFNDEPVPDPELLKWPNVIATPHIAANTVEAQERVAYEVIRQVLAFQHGRYIKLNLVEL